MPLPPKRHASRSPDGKRATKRAATSSPEEGELDDLSPPHNPPSPTPTSSGPTGHSHISISLPSKPAAPTLSSSSASLLSAGPSNKPRSVPFPFKKKAQDAKPHNGSSIHVLPPLSMLDPGPDPLPLGRTDTDSKRNRRPENNGDTGSHWESNYSRYNRNYTNGRDYHSKGSHGRRDRDSNVSWRDKDREGRDRERSRERDNRDRKYERDYNRDRDYRDRDKERDRVLHSLSPSGLRSPSPSDSKHRLPAPRSPQPSFSPLSSTKARDQYNYRDDFRERDRDRDYNKWDRNRGRDRDDRSAGYNRYVPASPGDPFHPTQSNWRNRLDRSRDDRDNRNDEKYAGQYAPQSPSPSRQPVSPSPPFLSIKSPSTIAAIAKPLVSPLPLLNLDLLQPPHRQRHLPMHVCYLIRARLLPVLLLTLKTLPFSPSAHLLAFLSTDRVLHFLPVNALHLLRVSPYPTQQS
ncbi:hypothetical protein BDQ17DRAFT_126506 [Cyathus striatus]|nr:hypothetical protein BDQ17DRAFT_126506 [Cyathus striatus]